VILFEWEEEMRPSKAKMAFLPKGRKPDDVTMQETTNESSDRSEKHENDSMSTWKVNEGILVITEFQFCY